MTWRWVFWRISGNGDAARHATEQATEELEKAHRQTRSVDRTTERAQALNDRTDWFTRGMEQALHFRRGPA